MHISQVTSGTTTTSDGRGDVGTYPVDDSAWYIKEVACSET